MAICSLGDFIWIIYWVPFWFSEHLAKWNNTLHFVIVFCVIANLVLKLIIIISMQFENKKDSDHTEKSTAH